MDGVRPVVPAEKDVTGVPPLDAEVMRPLASTVTVARE
jgi:hypothetical protein